MEQRNLVWIGQSRKDLTNFPDAVQEEVGYALSIAQDGGKSRSGKPLQGFPGASVLEIVSPYDSDTYRVVYTVSVPNVICVLHAFKKKSKRGIETPQRVVKLIRQRLKTAKSMTD